MLFVEPRFFLFFLIVFAVYWAIPGNRPRKVWLLGASWLFYAAWDWRFLIPMVAITVIDWWVGAKLGETGDPVRRHRLVLLALVTNLANLFFFKYFNFFADSLAHLLAAFGTEASWTTLNIVLPVGISFYTFHMLSYVIDVYRGELQPRRSLLDIALFAAIFPQLVAGPILRASSFLPQFEEKRSFAEVPVRACMTMFLIGYIKKACVSDNLSPFVDPVFLDPSAFTADAIVGAVLLYAVQIYCDFSGYSDMARGLAALMGVDLMVNFNRPYLATDPRDFWRRWHISLSTWLRDYLYIPLGGSRGGGRRTALALFATMVLGGLWHGAAWTFVAWGAFHGTLLVLHRFLSLERGVSVPDTLVGRWISRIVMFHLVGFGWLLFRAESLSQVSTVLSALGSSWSLSLWAVQGLAGVGGVTLLLNAVERWSREDVHLTPRLLAGLGVLWVLTWLAAPVAGRPFLYFQF